jgi:hypothetical protein
MIRLRHAVVTACAAVLLTACAEGDAETDRQSTTLAEAISYPHQADAAGFARAALATRLGQSPTFSLLEVTDLPHKDPKDAMAHLVWRIHRDADTTGATSTPGFDACYSVEFNYYQPSSGPFRVSCPEHAVAITPPPLPDRHIPPDFAPALESVLRNLGPTPLRQDVTAALAKGLPTPPVDPKTGVAGIPPDVVVQVNETGVGVALFARTGVDDKECLLGRRVGDEVRVWPLNWRDLGPLEKPCSAEAALAG